VCITVASLVAPVLRPPACLARRIASVIKSGFIRSSVHHFTSATLRRFHRRRLLHATDFFQAAGFTVRGGVSVFKTLPADKGQDERQIFKLSRCSRIFESTLINASAGCRVRESKIRLYVAGRRVNVLLASSGCAPHCTRRPAPGVLLLGFRARQDFHACSIIWN
jgi:hypothetical protein